MSQITELLEKAKKALHYQSTGFDYIDQVLLLLEQQPTETSIGNRVRQIAKKDKLGCTNLVSDKDVLNQAADRLDAWWKYIGELKEQTEQQPTAGDFTKLLRRYSRTCASGPIVQNALDEVADRFDRAEATVKLFKNGMEQKHNLWRKAEAIIKDLLEACLNSPAHNYFTDFAEFAEECMVKPSMAVYRNRFSGLATFLRSCVDRAKTMEAAISKAKKVGGE